MFTKITLPALAIIALAVFATTTAQAQSSGNFTATISTTQCTVNTVPGATGGSLSGGSPNFTVLDTYIKTPNSSFTTLLITPSLVTGLFNNTQVTGAMETSANSAAVRVFVTLDGKAVAPDSGGRPQMASSTTNVSSSSVAMCSIQSRAVVLITTAILIWSRAL